MNIRKALPLLALVLGAAIPAEALPPMTSSAEGVVRSVDVSTRTLTVDRSRGKALVLRWTPATTFVRDGKIADPASLKEGVRVDVRYRAPIFGPWTASRISF